ncbi:shikimate kinase [Geomonas sp. Red32]|uniref:shikimate kinase n=1 Tax=Geomonas sp. Red32 TaxID=2912856 RepID=UPI00202CFAD3|nr:shikimate kinase [Geomonas sp. Red32]MCM0083300.1 shikimate kinase [Geomonas sp. Red32]
MNLVLIGYRGTGKSRVGRVLAQRLGMSRVAMDDEIELKAGKTTPEIVAQWGWPKFRDLETEVARELAGRDGLVIDTGGGVIERPENMEVLSANALVVWMRASVETIVSRIQGGTNRPALVDGKSFTEEVSEVLERRTPLYQKAAHVEIDTDGLAPDEIARRIMVAWRERVGN